MQTTLTGAQQQAHNELDWYASEPKTSQHDRFADAAIATLVELMVSLIAPWSPTDAVPAPTAEPQPLAAAEAPLVVAHYATWARRLLGIAREFVSAILFADANRAPDAAKLLSEDTRGLLHQEEQLARTLASLEGEDARALAQQDQRNRLVVLWHQQRDAAFRAGLSGADHQTHDNIGMGDCGYASFVAGMGRDGVTPDPALGEAPHSALHQLVRDRAAEYHFGPKNPNERNLTNRQYQMTVRTRRDLLLAGELDPYAEVAAWTKRGGVWDWRIKPLSDGPLEGETKADWEAGGGRITANNLMQPTPSHAPKDREDENAYEARIDRAYQDWIEASRASSQSDGIPYWAQYHDWMAIAAAYKRRIHIYHITNDPPGTAVIRRFDHYESFGDPMHRPVCIAWTTADYRKGDTNRRDRTTQMHFAVILRRSAPYAPHVGWPEALLPYADVEPEPFGPVPTEAVDLDAEDVAAQRAAREARGRAWVLGFSDEDVEAQKAEMERLEQAHLLNEQERVLNEQAAALAERRRRLEAAHTGERRAVDNAWIAARRQRGMEQAARHREALLARRRDQGS